MSYLVLARKHRPQKFEDVVAQEHVTRTLQNAVKNGRIGSGYLFCGPRGTGKTTTARILAKALNCAEGPTPDPCGVCSACIEIANGTSLDVLEIDAASNTGVDDVRTLRENVRYLPAGGNKRIYIIDEVHRLSGAAFDALLKTLEEPPPHVVFMFATTEPMKVPETILSRTQRFDLRRVSASDLTAHLKKIAGREELDIDDAALALLARKADGSVRDSLSLLDQMAAFAGQKITEAEVISALALVDRQFLFDFTTAVAGHDSPAVLHLIQRMLDAGTDVQDFVSELLEHFRVLLIMANDREAASVLPFGADELDEYARQAEYFSVGDILRLVKSGIDLKADIRAGVEERLALEVTAVKMAEMESTVKLEEVLDRLKGATSPETAPANNLFGQVEKKKREPAPSAMKAPVAAPQEPPTPPSEFKNRMVNLPTLTAGWKKFLGFLKQKNGMLAAQLGTAEIRSIRDNEILAAFGPSGSVSRQVVEKPESLSLIGDCLREHYGANLGIRFEIDEKAEPPVESEDRRSRARKEVKKLVENSPRIRMLIEKVDGEIIGVKKVEE